MRRNLVRAGALAFLLAAGPWSPARAQTSPRVHTVPALPSRDPAVVIPREPVPTKIRIDGGCSHNPVPTYYIIDGRRVYGEAIASGSVWLDPTDVVSIRVLKGRRAFRAIRSFGRDAHYRRVVLIRTKSGAGPRQRPADLPRNECEA